jgi:hypothetical protein
VNIVQFPSRTKRIFLDRFVLYMLRHTDTYLMPHGRPVIDYAKAVASIYWTESQYDHLAPEEYAEADMSFWSADFGGSHQGAYL